MMSSTDRSGMIRAMNRESQLSKYFKRTPQNKTIQFISSNTEIRNSEYIFKEYRILNF